MNARLRYFVRVTMTRNYNGNVTTEKDFVVQNAQTTLAQQIANEPVPLPTKLEVGIEDCLHIEFEYDRQKYHLQVRH